MNEDEWMNVPLPSPLSLDTHSNFSCTPLPFFPSVTEWLPACPSLLTPYASPSFYWLVLWLWPVCITHISLSADPLSGCPYKVLSFPKVRSEPCTQVLSRHLVWKNKNRPLARPCPVTMVGMIPETRLRCPFPFLFLISSLLFFFCYFFLPPPLLLGNQDTRPMLIGSQGGYRGLDFCYWKCKK